ncbi:vesicle transport through interaction with t-SNAREs 1a [Lycorma delicatula]|uniref:vesicle transport through interaction with t-SNAREs 1a n=1 Tax=Lycorma delicatula TaxID=130591 RepID=UPI003F517705
MAVLIDVYEQQYAVLTADITSKIGNLSNSAVSDVKHAISELDKLIEEVKELLEQMGLEVHDMKQCDQPKMKTRLESYRAELRRLEHEFSKAKINFIERDGDAGMSYRSDVSDSLYSQHVSLNEEQKQRLLDNSERIERAGKNLIAGYQVLLETEDVGNQVLRDLHSQRETIQRARNRLRDTDAELNRSTRIINGMIARSLQHRFILSAISIVFCLAVISTIYFSYSS